MRITRIVAGILLCSVFALPSCKKSPPVTPEGPRSEDASFVGIGNLEGGPTNILVILVDTDSSGYTSGTITYRSVTTAFADLDAPASSDTVRFAYTRGGIDYSGWALRHVAGLAAYFTEPDGIPAFDLNQELGGYNMTGLWSGDMSSTALQGQRLANMTMDQSGSLFLGEVEVTLSAPWIFQLTNGSTNAASFQVSGTVQTELGSYPALFTGNFSGPDVVLGFWDAGSELKIDLGEFQFTRSFN